MLCIEQANSERQEVEWRLGDGELFVEYKALVW
jgi:hypothetical protein